MSLAAPNTAAERAREGAESPDILRTEDVFQFNGTSVIAGQVEEIGGVPTRKVLPVPNGVLEQASSLVREFERAPVDEQDKVRTRMMRLRDRGGKNNILTLAAGIALAVILVGGVGGCNKPNNQNNTPGISAPAVPGGELATKSFPLTAVDNGHWDEQGSLNFMVPENQYWGIEVVEIEGRTVILFTVKAPGEDEKFQYVDCDSLLECATAGVAKNLEGTELFDGLKAYSATVNKDSGKAYLKVTAGGMPRKADIGFNGLDNLEISNIAIEPSFDAFSFTMNYEEESGVEVPYIYAGGGAPIYIKKNLVTGALSEVNVSSECDLPHRDTESGFWYHSKLVNVGGAAECRLVWAETIEDLISDTTQYIGALNAGGPTNMRFQVRGDIAVFQRDDPVNGKKLYYAVVESYCGDGTCDDDEDGVSCPEECAVIPPDGDDDAGGGDDDVDAGGGDDDVDAGGGDDDLDAGGEDVTPIDLCEFAETNVNIIDGECTFHNCDPEKQILDVVGKCSFEVYLGGENPTILTIDGGYGLNLLDKAGDFLYGKYDVDDNGNDWGTKFGNYGLGVDGTKYGGEERSDGNEYYVYCEEGKISMYWIDANGDRELIESLEAGEDGIYFVDENPLDDPDIIDKKGGGCSAGPGNSSRQQFELLLLLGLAITALRRRNGKEA